MRKKYRKQIIYALLVLGIILLSITSTPIFAQTKTRPTKTQRKSPPPPRQINPDDSKDYSQDSIPDIPESLPAGFIGHSVKTLYSNLLPLSNSKKDEFETTEEYQARVQRLRSQPIIGKLTPNSLFAFTFKPKSTYDADRKILSASLDVYDPEFNASLTWKNYLIDTHTYSASSAFGRKFPVLSRTFDSYRVRLINHDAISIREPSDNEIFKDINADDTVDIFTRKRSLYKLESTLPDIRPDQARGLKDNIRMLVICRITGPLVSDDRLVNEPTTTMPAEVKVNVREVHVIVREILAYHALTGVILWREAITNTKSAKNIHSSATSKAGEVDNINSFITDEFDPSATSVGSRFVGHNALLLAEVLKARHVEKKKKEFETSEDNKRRVAELASRPLFNKIQSTSIIALVLTNLNATYDADKKLMMLKVELDPNLSTTRLESSIVIWHNPRSVYNGNLLAEANRIRFNIVNLSGVPFIKITDVKYNAELQANFEVDIPEARETKSELKFLLVCRLAEPFLSEHILSPDIPIIHINALELWAFNFKTGKVYIKISAN